jgi:hypothetical protein
MDAAAHSAQRLAEALQRIVSLARARLTPEDWDIVEEAIRRVKQHEELVHDVLPNLRLRLPETDDPTSPSFPA